MVEAKDPSKMAPTLMLNIYDIWCVSQPSYPVDVHMEYSLSRYS